MSITSNRSIIRKAANIATILFGITGVLQLLLAIGILPVSMAWGGRQPVLTTSLRISSLVAIVILAFFAFVIRRRAKLVDGVAVPMIIKILSWVITAYMALNTLGNLTSLSLGEKILFGPIAFLLTVSCLLISLSKSEA